MTNKNQKKIKIPIVGIVDSKTEKVYFDWEKEFELRFNNWKEDILFWKQDIKDTIKNLLAQKLAEQNKKLNAYCEKVLAEERERVIKEYHDLLDELKSYDP